MNLIIKLLIIGIILVGGALLIVPIDASLPEPTSVSDIIEQKINFLKEGIISVGTSISDSIQEINFKF